MSSYKLYTFEQKDAGEVIRRILVHSGKQFEDVRVKKGEQWDKLKPQTPNGCLPVLEENGKKLGGTIAIAEYLGETLGLAAGGDAWSRAQLNSICDLVLETVVVLSRYWSENDPDLRKRKKAEVLANAIPTRLSQINKLIENNGCPNGYARFQQLTYADFFVHHLFCDILPRVYDENDQQAEAKKYLSVGKLCKTVHSHIKDHLGSCVHDGHCWEC